MDRRRRLRVPRSSKRVVGERGQEMRALSDSERIRCLGSERYRLSLACVYTHTGDSILKLGLQGHHFAASSVSILFVAPSFLEGAYWCPRDIAILSGEERKLLRERGLSASRWHAKRLFSSLLLLTVHAEHLANIRKLNSHRLYLGFRYCA